MHRYRDIAFDMSNIAILATFLAFNPRRKILHGGQPLARIQNGVERLRKISTGWVGCTNVTDRWTDLRQQVPERRVKRHAHKSKAPLNAVVIIVTIR